MCNYADNIPRMGSPIKESQENRKAEGSRLRKSMVHLGITQQSIADDLNIEQNLVSQWCTGRTRIPDIDVLWLGEKLGFDPISFRPSLAKFRKYFKMESILDGLGESEKVHIKAVIRAFKKPPSSEAVE